MTLPAPRSTKRGESWARLPRPNARSKLERPKRFELSTFSLGSFHTEMHANRRGPGGWDLKEVGAL